MFEYEQLDEAKDLEARWTNLAEKAKANRTVFAQRRLKPEEVLPEWQRMQRALGSQEDVRRFVRAPWRGWTRRWSRLPRGCARAAGRTPGIALREAAASRMAWTAPCASISRSRPLPVRVSSTVAILWPTALADDLLERALDDGADARHVRAPRPGRRAGDRRPLRSRRTVLLLRLRHQLTWTRHDRSRTLLVEEALPVALVGRSAAALETGEHVLHLLDAEAAGDLPGHVRARVLADTLEGLPALREQLEEVASRQAESLLADHRRVREAAEARGRYDVRALLPVDVIAAAVLIPVS